MMKSKRNGFTLIESLLSLYVSLLVAGLALLLILSSYHLITSKDNIQIQLAILQLRQRAALSTCTIENENLVMDFNHTQYVILYDRHRLVKKEGYEILMENIDGATFYEKDSKIFLRVQRQDTNRTYQIN